MATVGLIGTFDTKRVECEYLAARIRARGAAVLTIDVGPLSDAETDVCGLQRLAAPTEELGEARPIDGAHRARSKGRGCSVISPG